MSTIRIPQKFQGPTGLGQGGWTAAQFVAAVGQPATVRIKSHIPLETDLHVCEVDDGWQLVDQSTEPATVVLEAQRWDPDFMETTAVSIEEASKARHRFPGTEEDHPVPNCFSCGIHDNSMNVHPGPLGDGRWASDWAPTQWTVGDDGLVDESVLWAALDCTAGWVIGTEGVVRPSFTVQFAAEVIKPIVPDATYAIVGWGQPEWDGRKRWGASAAFDQDGKCVARSRSFWVAVQTMQS